MSSRKAILFSTLALVLVIVTLSCIPHAQAATPSITLVAHTAAGSDASPYNTVTTSAINTVGANFEFACGTIPPYEATGLEGTMTDSLGNTWVPIANSGVTPYYGQTTLFYSANPTVGPAQTFTYSYPPYYNVGASVAVMAFSGVASGPDQQSEANTSADSSLPSGLMIPVDNNELVISCLESVGNITSVTQSPLTHLDGVTQDAGNYPSIDDAYQIQTTATAVNPTWSFSSPGYSSASTLSATFFSTEAPATLVINTVGLPEGFVNTNYTAPTSIYNSCLAAVGGIQPYTWSVSSGALPNGLSLNSSTGCITGTPTTAQSASNVTFKVVDSQATATTVTLPMTIASTPLTFGLGTCSNPITGTQYQAISSCTLGGSGGTSPLTYSVDTTNDNYMVLPAGLSLNPSSGMISGTDYFAGSPASTGLQPPADLILTDSLGTIVHLSNLNFVMNGDYSWLESASTCGNIFPCDSIFSSAVRLDSLPVDTSPAADLAASAYASASIKIEPWIPFIKIPPSQPDVPVTTIAGGYQIMFPPYTLTTPAGAYNNVTSSGPIPSYQPVEGNVAPIGCALLGGGGDCHALGIQLNSNGTINSLWEQWGSSLVNGSWEDLSNISWNQSEYTAETMPAQGAGSADAAGLPITAALVTYDQLMNGQAGLIRFTLPHPLNYHVWPATSQAGVGICTGGYEDSNRLILQPGSPGGNAPTSCGSGYAPPLGEIYRINSATWASPPNPCLTDATTNPQASRLFTAMRQHGLILADGGGAGYAIVAADARWNQADLACISNYLTLSDLEPVNVESIIKNLDSNDLPTVSYQTTEGENTTSTSPDTTPPTTSITSPTSGSTVSSTISVSASASDNVGVTSVSLYVDGSLESTDTNAPYTFSLNTTALSNGSHTLVTKAYDAAGNVGTSANVTITVSNNTPDTTPPSVPTGLTVTSVTSSSIALSWTASTDNVGVTGYNIYRGGVKIGTSGTNAYTNTGLAASTTYSYTVSAYDAAGNTSAQSGSISGTTSGTGGGGDTTPPTTSITSPANNASESGTISITASASDNVGVTSVALYVDGILQSTDTNAPYTFSLNTTNLSNGSHTLSTKAYDAAGNVGTSANVTISVSNTVATPPVTPPPSSSGAGGGGSVVPPPVPSFSITSVSVSGITQTSAQVTVTTHIAASIVVKYGRTTLYGNTTQASPALVTNYVKLAGLSPNTIYDFVVIATPPGGTSVTSEVYTLTTAGGGAASSTVTNPPAFTENLAYGDTSSEVTLLQTILFNQGFLPLKAYITGYFGTQTEHALLLFQNAHDLNKSGFVDLQTESLLNKVAAAETTTSGTTTTQTTTTTTTPSTPASGGTITQNLAPGSTGPEVAILQHLLNTDGVYPAAIYTQYYGSLTEAAVKLFQTREGIVSYGTPATTGYGAVGPKTRGKLDGG